MGGALHDLLRCQHGLDAAIDGGEAFHPGGGAAGLQDAGDDGAGAVVVVVVVVAVFFKSARDQVGALEGVAEGAPEFGFQGAYREPAVGAGVDAVVGDAADEQVAAAIDALAHQGA